MFCVSKASLLLVGLALSPSICKTAEQAESEKLDDAIDQLEVVIERNCGDQNLETCKDSVEDEIEVPAAQDLSDD